MSDNKTRGPQGEGKSASATRPRESDNGVNELAACLVKGIPEEMIALDPETVEIFEQLIPVTIVTDAPERSGALVVDAPKHLSPWFTHRAPELITKTLQDQVDEFLKQYPFPRDDVDITSKEVAAHLSHGGVEHFPLPCALDVEGPFGPHVLGDFNQDPRSQVPAPDANYASRQLEEGPFQLGSQVFPQGMVLVRHSKAFQQGAHFSDADKPPELASMLAQAATVLWDNMLRMMREDALRPPSFDHFVKPVERSEQEWREDERFRSNTENILVGCDDLPHFQIEHFSVVIRWWHAEKQTRHVYVSPTFRSIAGRVRGRYVEADTVCESLRA